MYHEGGSYRYDGCADVQYSVLVRMPADSYLYLLSSQSWPVLCRYKEEVSCFVLRSSVLGFPFYHRFACASATAIHSSAIS